MGSRIPAVFVWFSPRMHRTDVGSLAVSAHVWEMISTVIVIVSWKRLNLRIVGSILIYAMCLHSKL